MDKIQSKESYFYCLFDGTDEKMSTWDIIEQLQLLTEVLATDEDDALLQIFTRDSDTVPAFLTNISEIYVEELEKVVFTSEGQYDGGPAIEAYSNEELKKILKSCKISNFLFLVKKRNIIRI